MMGEETSAEHGAWLVYCDPSHPDTAKLLDSNYEMVR